MDTEKAVSYLSEQLGAEKVLTLKILRGEETVSNPDKTKWSRYAYKTSVYTSLEK